MQLAALGAARNLRGNFSDTIDDPAGDILPRKCASYNSRTSEGKRTRNAEVTRSVTGLPSNPAGMTRGLRGSADLRCQNGSGQAWTVQGSDPPAKCPVDQHPGLERFCPAAWTEGLSARVPLVCFCRAAQAPEDGRAAAARIC